MCKCDSNLSLLFNLVCVEELHWAYNSHNNSKILRQSEQLSLPSKYCIDPKTPEFNLQSLNLNKLVFGAHWQEQTI